MPVKTKPLALLVVNAIDVKIFNFSIERDYY